MLPGDSPPQALRFALEMTMAPHASNVPHQTIADAAQALTPKRRWRLREIARRRREREENNRMAPVIPLLCLGYFSVGVIVNIVDAEYLTAAWLFAGALGVALWMTRQAKMSLVNVYTLVLGLGMTICLIFFVLSRGWLI
jgi:hypothetical protein